MAELTFVCGISSITVVKRFFICLPSACFFVPFRFSFPLLAKLIPSKSGLSLNDDRGSSSNTMVFLSSINHHIRCPAICHTNLSVLRLLISNVFSLPHISIYSVCSVQSIHESYRPA